MLSLPKLLLLTLLLGLLSCGAGERDPVADAKFENEQRIGREDITERQEQDADFMVEAATGSAYGAALGQLAARQTANAPLRTFGQQLQRDASQLSNALRTLATQKGLTLPEGLSSRQQKQLDELAALSGPAFDRELLAAATDYLDDAQDAFDDMADDAYDGDIRGVAAKYAPTLQSHYEHADELEDQLPK
jgi:putative membrane protein